MSHPNENIFSCCVGGYKSERPLVLSIKIIKSKIQKAETELKEADGDDDDAKIEIKKYKRKGQRVVPRPSTTHPLHQPSTTRRKPPPTTRKCRPFCEHIKDPKEEPNEFFFQLTVQQQQSNQLWF